MCSRRALWRSPGSLPPCRLRVQTICHPGDPRHMDPRNQCMALDKCDLFNVTCWTLLASPKFHIHFIPGACRSRQAVPQPVCDCDNCGPQRSMRGSRGCLGHIGSHGLTGSISRTGRSRCPTSGPSDRRGPSRSCSRPRCDTPQAGDRNAVFSLRGQPLREVASGNPMWNTPTVIAFKIRGPKEGATMVPPHNSDHPALRVRGCEGW